MFGPKLDASDVLSFGKNPTKLNGQIHFDFLDNSDEQRNKADQLFPTFPCSSPTPKVKFR